MKRITKLIFAALNLALLTGFLLPSCDKMDDIQKTYAEREEMVYLGKVDSVKFAPGFGKVKLVWHMNADPKVEQTVIYWNLRRDSLVKPFTRTGPGPQKDSVVLENMPEGSLLIEFKNTNSKGESSLISSATVSVWGPEFADGLRARTISALDYDYNASTYNLTLSAATPGDSVVYSEIEYTTKSNQTRTLKIAREENNVTLPDFADGGTFTFRSIFFPPQGIDTVYGAKKPFETPTAIHESGTKISLAGHSSSRYFNYNGDLGEWNANGDLIVYSVAANGELTEKERHNGIAPRATFRDFFFYDADRFIRVGVDNVVYMYQFADGVLSNVKTPTNVDALGTGFTFPAFIPARGFFFSLTPATGELRTWFAFNNATWGAPNGGTVTNSNITFPYSVSTLFNYGTLLGVDPSGNLRSVSVLASGSLGSLSRAGLGWGRFTKLISVGTKLYAMESNGDLYVFNNFNAEDNFWIVN